MSADVATESPLHRYVTVLRRRIGILIIFVVFVPTVAVSYSLTQPKLYQASSTVLINRQSVASQLEGSADVGLQQQSFQQVLVTQARLARTPDVLRSTLARAGSAGRGLSMERLRDDSSVEANADSDLLTFDVIRPEADSARRLVRAYADEFVRYRRTLDSAALSRALKDVDATIAEAKRNSNGSGDSLINGLTTSRQQLETRLALQSANAQVVAGPEQAVQVRPRPLRTGILGLAVGLILGLAAALVRNTLDTRVRTGEDAEGLLNRPIVGRIPRPRLARGGRTELVMLEPSGIVQAEGFRLLRSNLSFGLLSSDAKVVMVTSSTQGEGKSTTIANLAVAYALTGKRVAVVDLDLRRPSLARLFNVAGGAGVSGVALGQASLRTAIVPIDLGRVVNTATSVARTELHLLVPGALPPNPSEFINAQAVRAIVTDLREQYDLVLIDSPPLVSVSDTSVIADLVDAVFVCVRLGVATRRMLTEFRTALDRLAIPVLGVVVTAAESDDHGAYGGYYAYSATPAGNGSKEAGATA